MKPAHALTPALALACLAASFLAPTACPGILANTHNAPHRLSDESRVEPAGITKQPFGEARGQPVEIFTLTNKNGMVAKITNYGGIITELHAPDRDGKMGDVVLGFDNLDAYLKPNPFFGALVGRYGNRIANAKFTLDGIEYTLAANNGKNHLHGGRNGFNKVVWAARVIENAAARHGSAGVPPANVAQTAKSAFAGNAGIPPGRRREAPPNPPNPPSGNLALPDSPPAVVAQTAKSADEAQPRPTVNREPGFERSDRLDTVNPGGEAAAALELTYTAKDGEEGYPGNLRVTVTYTLTDDNELIIDYRAVTDKPTPCNLTNHTYFNLNLAAGARPTIANHELMLHADHYTEVGPGLIPTGKLPAVAGTPMDFTKPRRIGERADDDFEQLKLAGGYDHNWVLRKPVTTNATATAAAESAASGSAEIPLGRRREAPPNPSNSPNPPSGNLALPDSAATTTDAILAAPAIVAQTAKSAKGRANPPGEPLHGTAQPEASPYPKATQTANSVNEAQPRPAVNHEPGTVNSPAPAPAKPTLAATVYEPQTGRLMEVFTTEPGIQFYSGNFLNGKLTGKNGIKYVRRAGLCLETQHFPDSPNQPTFPSTILRPGQTYHSQTIYKFSVK